MALRHVLVAQPTPVPSYLFLKQRFMIQFAAATFEIVPKNGLTSGSLWPKPLTKVFSPLKSSVFLVKDDSRLIVLHTSHFVTDFYCVSILLRDALARALGIPIEQVFCFSSHNHCAVRLHAKERESFVRPALKDLDPEQELTVEGLEMKRRSVEAALRLKEQLRPVEVRFGMGKERRITHNRKGRRADGTTYMMRESDRLLLGEDFVGDIDDDAFVVGFFEKDGRAAGFLTQFTGHPVTAFHCDYPIVCAEFPQVACDDLASAYGGVPVGFLQGCAGDTNAKGLLSDLPIEESVVRSEKYGHHLGETFIKIAQNLKRSGRADLSSAWRDVWLPFREVPSVDELEARLRELNAFLARCEAGDELSTRHCDGLNFPSNMSVSSRVQLIAPTRRWLEWALAFHREHRLHEAPIGIEIPIAAIRIGDVGIIGIAGEPLLGIGRQIKRAAVLPATIPCGYMNEGEDAWAYIPDGPNCEDLDYPSSYYRYTRAMLPYRQPAGDLLASAAVQMLEKSLASPGSKG